MSKQSSSKADLKNLKFSVPEVLTCTTVVLQVIFLVYLNLFKMSELIDVDAAKHMRHSIEIARSGMFIPFWNYLTYGELDNVCLFAAPLYKLTGNIYLSFGIINIIGIFIFAGIIYRILKNLGIDRRALLIVLLVAFAPTSLGMLGYLKCSFFGAGYYAFRFMVPLLLIAVLSTPKEGRKKPLNIVLIILSEASILLTATSSSLFVIGVAIAPVVLCFIILILRDGFGKYKYEAVVLAVAMVMSGVGLVLSKLFGISSNVSGMIIRASSQGLVYDILRSVNSLFQIIVGNSSSTEALFSINGFEYVFAVFAAILVFAFGFSALSKVFLLRSKKDDSKERDYEAILISVFAWSFIVNVITDSSLRYQLLGFFPLLIVASWRMVNSFDKIEPKALKAAFGIVPAVLFAGITLLNGMHFAIGYANQYDSVEATGKKFMSLMESRSCSLVYFYAHNAMPEMMRLYDTENLYLTIDPETKAPKGADFYYNIWENTAVPQHNFLMINEADGVFEDLIPEVIAKNYTFVENIDGYYIYESDVNLWDGLSGLPVEGAESLDFSYSPGYSYNTVKKTLTSPSLSPDGCSYTATIKVANDYDCSNISCGNLEVTKPQDFDGYSEVTIRIPSGDSCRILFENVEDLSQIISIRYSKES